MTAFTSNIVLHDEVVYDQSIAKDNFDYFNTRFEELYREAFIINKTIKNKSKRDPFFKPYIAKAIAKSCKVKNKLHNSWIKSRGSSYEQITMARYKSYRSSLKSLIATSKANHFISKFKSCHNSIRGCWKIINEIRCKYRKQVLPNQIASNHKIIYDRRSILQLVQALNTHFVNTAKKLNNNKYHNAEYIPNYRSFLKHHVKSSITFSDIETPEIMEIINNIDSSKSTDISPKIIKCCSEIIAPYLRKILSDCMNSGYFPDVLKIARVIPLYKTGDVNDPGNYHPISILPIISKVLEKIIYNRMYDFLDENNVLNNCQYGFRKNHSTEHALHDAITSIM